VPSGGPGRDPTKEVSIIYDNRAKLNDRIARFQSGDVLAQEPRRPMRRLISNIEVEATGDAELTVLSNFILVMAELHEQAVWAGQSIHKLRERGEGFAILFKKVILVNNDIEMPPLQFLV
jgi:3-phenylpropionate/cinnamic acid dioxygenase small subunit